MAQCFIIAEAGVNHNGTLEIAKRLVEAAATAGADAVKFQSFHASELVTVGANKADYQATATGYSESQLEMLRRLELNEAAHHSISSACREHDIEFMSTPFDMASLDLLLGMGVQRIKIASGDLTNAPLLLRAARSQKPIILSTGMSSLAEIQQALAVLAFGYSGRGDPRLEAFHHVYESDEGQEQLRERVTVLHCTTQYPAPFNEVNLRAMDTLRDSFGLPVGLSDHTEGIAIAIAAAARGATVIEKHLTLDRNMPGPDHRASIEAPELAQLVRSIRQVEQALGEAAKAATAGEQGNRAVARRSLVAAAAIAAGEIFTETNITAKRPGTGMSPLLYWEVIGKQATRSYQPDEVIEL